MRPTPTVRDVGDHSVTGSGRYHAGMPEPGLVPVCGHGSHGLRQVASHVTKDVGMVEEAQVLIVGDDPGATREYAVVGMR